MTTKKKLSGSDIYLGYFAGVVIALMTSTGLADVIVSQLVKFVPLENDMAWRVNLSAGLFFGISFANPIGMLISRNPAGRSLKFLIAGFIFGVVAQITVFTPVAGTGLSTFVHLLVVGSVVPLAMCKKQIDVFLKAHGFNLNDVIAKSVLAVAQWPDRLLFILLMGGSFSVFWRFTHSTEQILIALVLVLTVLTLAIALRRPANVRPQDVHPDFQDWLDLEAEDHSTMTLAETARDELRKLISTMLPGAILFGGMTRLAVDILVRLYPNLQANLNDPAMLWQTLGLVAASGLGLVFFGILISLGFSLMLLQMIGRLRNWTNAHLRENCFRLLRTLYFRPMKRT